MHFLPNVHTLEIISFRTRNKYVICISELLGVGVSWGGYPHSYHHICGRGDPLTPITMCGCLYTVEGQEVVSASLFPAQCFHGVCATYISAQAPCACALLPMASLNLDFFV